MTESSDPSGSTSTSNVSVKAMLFEPSQRLSSATNTRAARARSRPDTRSRGAGRRDGGAAPPAAGGAARATGM